MLTAYNLVDDVLGGLGVQIQIDQAARQYEFRGSAANLPNLNAFTEILLSGPAGTGKSLAALHYMNRLMWSYPGARALFVRKVRADISQSALVTFEQGVLGEDHPICANIQRPYRQRYLYPNGSEIVIGGMDRPQKVMSAEYDVIYVQEAVELDEVDWESLTTRLRNGKIPYQQLIADTNPGAPDHWLKQRCDRGLTVLLQSYHEDNPRYWDGETWTPDGVKYVLGILEKLSGVRKDRLRWGKWVAAEGMVYEDWREDLHLIDRFEIPLTWRRFIAVDFGFTNPFVAQWWAVDPDGRLYLYREIYKTQRLVEDHGREIKRLSAGERIECITCDHDAEGRATLERHAGIKTQPAKKAIQTGVQAVQARLRLHADQRPRLYVFRDALAERDIGLEDRKLPVSTKDEISGYVWADKRKKEEPLDEDNHGMDTMRYAVMHIDGKMAVTSIMKARTAGLWRSTRR
jgi:phage terminase large subunit